MNKQHPHRANILPLPEGTPRPLWSVMIPTYNCANYLRETLASVLAQDLGSERMQIEVIDDHSTKDDPEAVVKELAGDRVKFYRQPQNVGHIKNFNTCLQRSRGKWIHLLHGDDCVKNGFYLALQKGFETNPDIGAAFCRHLFVDDQGQKIWISELEQSESGVLSNWLEKIAVKQRVQPPSIVVRRSVYEELGGFDSRICCYGEDWEMSLRIAANYTVWYEIEPLALYRMQSNSLTGRSTRTGQNIRDLRKIIEFSQSYLPQSTASKLSNQARENFAHAYLDQLIPKLINEGDLIGATNQIKELIKMSYSLKTLKKLIRLGLSFSKQQLINNKIFKIS